MKIIVKTKPGAKRESVERVDQPTLDLGGPKSSMPVYKISVKEPAVEGKANEALVKTLAQHFKVAHRSVRLVSGRTSKTKVFEIK